MGKQKMLQAAVCLFPLFAGAQTIQKPNILLILADDMRGTTIHTAGVEDTYTPCLDALAQDGTLFTNAHIMGGTSGAVSMPSRAMLMTGKYLHTLQQEGAVIPQEQKTIGEALQENGYTTFHIGKWHNDTQAFNRCFNQAKAVYFGGMYDHWNVPLFDYHEDGDYSACRPIVKEWSKSNKVEYLPGEYVYSGKHSVDIFTHEAIKFIQAHKAEAAQRPFFLSLAYMSPHDPRTMPEEYRAHYQLDSIQLPPNFLPEHPFDNGELKIRDEMLAAFPRTKEEIRQHLYDYYAMISHVDKRVGEIVSALKEAGLYDNTIIIFAGDNGLAVGQHGLMGKQSVYEHSVRVPLIIKEAGKTPATSPRRTDKLCYLIDILPTLCELTETPIPDSADGQSLLPILTKDESVRDYLYYGYRFYQRAISDGIWKLIEYNVDGTRTTQLFNLQQDPYEMHNLAGEAAQRKRIKQLRQQMSRECETTHDPVERYWE